MIRRAIALLGLCLLLAAAFAGCKSPEQLQSEQDQGSQTLVIEQLPVETLDLLTVTGTSVVTLFPDTAVFQLAVRTPQADPEAKAPEEAPPTHAQRVAEVKAALAALGIPQSALAETAHATYPAGPEQPYAEETVLTVTLSPLDKFPQLAEILSGDVALLNEPVYSCSAYDQLYQEALVEALENAQDKAAALSAALGTPLSLRRSVSEEAAEVAPFDEASLAGGARMVVRVTLQYALEAAEEE